MGKELVNAMADLDEMKVQELVQAGLAQGVNAGELLDQQRLHLALQGVRDLRRTVGPRHYGGFAEHRVQLFVFPDGGAGFGGTAAASWAIASLMPGIFSRSFCI